MSPLKILPARFHEAYGTIARKLGLPGLESPNVDLLQLVHDWLSNERHGSWLMILDNVDDMETFFTTPSATSEGVALITYIPRSMKGKVIVTTRDDRVGERLADRKKCITVPLLGEYEAVRLLQSKLYECSNCTEADAASLVKALDCLPLAITQAAAFISENHCTLRNYLKMLQASEPEQMELLTEDLFDPRRPTNAPSSVVQTWKLSYDLVRTWKLRAAEILAMMAVLDRHGVPKSLLQRDGDGV